MPIKESTSTSAKKKSNSIKVDFGNIALPSLKKYRKAHGIKIKATASREELADAIGKHFATLPAPNDEEEILQSFSAALKGTERKKRSGSPQKS